MPKLQEIIGDDGRHYFFTPKTKQLRKVTENGKIFWDKKSGTLGYIPNNVRDRL